MIMTAELKSHGIFMRCFFFFSSMAAQLGLDEGYF